MNNNPENEKINEIETENSSNEEFSTIFSNPQEHSKAKAKKSKRLSVIIASVLAVAVLISGTVAVIKLIPEREEETKKPAVEEIEVLKFSSDDFKTVTVKNSNGTFKLYSVTEESTSSDTESQSSKKVNWYIEGYDKELLNTNSVASVADAAAEITATLEITEKNVSDCGLDKPIITVDVVPAEKETYSLYIGSESPDKTGNYLKLSNSDKIYLVESNVKETFDFTDLEMAETSAMPGINVTENKSNYLGEDGTLTTFDEIIITGVNFPKKVVIEPFKNKEISTYISYYYMTSPEKRVAENVDGVFALFKAGLTPTGVYSFDKSSASLKKFGLNSPDFTVTMKASDAKLTYSFKQQSDGNYAVICDGDPMIKSAAETTVAFVNYETKNFYSDWVCLYSLSDLKGFNVSTPDKKYEFGIEKIIDEDESTTYNITYDGKKTDTQSFQDFYQKCISISCTDFDIENINADPDYVFEFVYEDKIGGKSVVEFTKASATRYQYRVDGKALGKVNSAALKSIIDALMKLVSK